MSHTRGHEKVADVKSWRVALKVDVWNGVLDALPKREPVCGAWPEPRFHPPHPPLFPPLDHLFHPDRKQALLDNNAIIYYLPGFCTAASCGLAIETPVPSEEHIDKDPSRQHLKNSLSFLTLYLYFDTIYILLSCVLACNCFPLVFVAVGVA